MIKSVENLNEVRGNAIADLNRYACRVLVCSGTGCIATGSNKIHEIFENIEGRSRRGAGLLPLRRP